MARYFVIASFPVGDSESRSFARRDLAADFAYEAVRAQYESQGLLDRPGVHKALALVPDDVRTIPVDPVTGQRILRIECGFQRVVTINAGSSKGLQAAKLAARVAGMSAWNHTSEELRQISHARRNGSGLRLAFHDGSAAFIPAGSASVRVVA